MKNWLAHTAASERQSIGTPRGSSALKKVHKNSTKLMWLNCDSIRILATRNATIGSGESMLDQDWKLF
jgi:hypothetical protein